MSTKTVGVVGYGGFGKLVARLLEGRVNVKVASRNEDAVPPRLRASLEQVAACDYVVLAIPLAAYRTVLTELAEHMAPTTTVVDVCSVKVIPCQLVQELLPDNKLVATHPLFGPQTASERLTGLTMVVCDEQSDAAELAAISAFCAELGLDVVHMSAEEHDREMAKVHALTFFIARGLFDMDMSSVRLKTPSFGRLESLIELEHNHTRELFDTIQLGNPFAEAMRDQLVHNLETLATEIKQMPKEY